LICPRPELDRSQSIGLAGASALSNLLGDKVATAQERPCAALPLFGAMFMLGMAKRHSRSAAD
jgi:hypothetical protein